MTKSRLSFTVRQRWVQSPTTCATLVMLFNFSGFPHKPIVSCKPQNTSKVVIRVPGTWTVFNVLAFIIITRQYLKFSPVMMLRQPEFRQLFLQSWSQES